ncbi:hypothetical protein NC652_013117 [Populus alba x Populus x berolinensis]|nr:hypothetical protein NC652_013117 [Populus alba x Populus x berolinensis]
MSVRIEAAEYITGSGRGVHSEEDLARAERESMEEIEVGGDAIRMPSSHPKTHARLEEVNSFEGQKLGYDAALPRMEISNFYGDNPRSWIRVRYQPRHHSQPADQFEY